MRKLLVSIFLIITCLYLYGRYIEVNNIKINEYSIKSESIPTSFEDLKIVHFSDILYDVNYNNKKLDDIANLINKEKADIVIFTGDLLKNGNSYNEEDYNKLKEFMTSIEASLYKYAVIGDNDQYYLEQYKDILYESDFILLDNESKLLFYKDNTPINIIGYNNGDISNLMSNEIAFNYTLAITHKPDNFTYLESIGVNTVIAGNSLGGIVNIPYYGGLIHKDGANTYINKYYKLNNSELFVSNGLGYEKFNFRLFNTPSINIYRFN